MNKKFFLIIVLVLGAVIGLWTWTIAAPNNSISIGGSASVQPLLKKLTDSYKTDDRKKFVYSATGSGAGVTNVQQDVYQIGFISKSVKKDDWNDNVPINENDTLLKQDIDRNDPDWYWKQLKENKEETKDTYRAVEIAKDEIVFVYNSTGTGMDKFLKETKLSFSFEVSDNNKISEESSEILKSIYEHDNQSELITWNKLAHLLIDQQAEQEDEANFHALADKLVSNKIKITPYSSTSGSGTRTSFTDLTQVKKEDGTIRGVLPGQATKEYNSNGGIFGQIQRSPGSIGFVSMLYATHSNQAVKAVNLTQGDKTWDVNKGKVEGYPLTRPFIAIFNFDYDENKDNTLLKNVVNFIYWVATSEKAEKAYKSLGLTQLITNT